MFRINRESHLVRETPEAQFLRRELGEPGLFTYWDRDRSTWALAYWLDGGSQGFADFLDDLPGGEDGPVLNRDNVRKYRAWHRPPDYAKHKQRVIENERKRIRDWQDETNEHNAMQNHLKKRRGRQVYFN